MIIDVHTHVFPDQIAKRAVEKLEPNSRCKAFGPATVDDLRSSMRKSGVDRSVIASIATKPGQSDGILEWSLGLLRGVDRMLIPLGSVHPDEDYVSALTKVKTAGLKGVKLHPFFQGFRPDDERMIRYFSLCRDLGLVVLVHAGNDIGFPASDIASPVRFARLIDAVPGLKLVAAHLGGWLEWDAVLTHLSGKDIWLDTAYVRGYVPDSLAMDIFREFSGRLLFGSDYPWSDPSDDIRFVETFVRSPEEKAAVLGGTWERLAG
jgi:predicted TIM-barrel fold metal-dependent hydrolase